MMRTNKLIPLAVIAVLLSGCEKKERLGPVPVLEPVPPISATRSTYTGTTVDFVYASTTSPPVSGDDYRQLMDRNSVRPDTAAVFGTETADTGIYADINADTALNFADRPDMAYNDSVEADTGITAENFADRADTAARPERFPSETADTNS